MEDVWKDISLTTPSLSLLPLEPSVNASGSTTNTSSFSLSCQHFLRAPLPNGAPPFSADTSELKFVLEKNIDEGIISSTSSPATEDPIDRRRKRIMKNRESAARSRARKQAYTKQLQLEIDNLQKENKKLKRQYEELLREWKAQAPPPSARKDVLQRTLSAPY